ncbi:predicted protein [Streptomyces viridosporus ATCC 14672]|uniref:Predicted protein n=1 Tax=Streptomyces viridosporus (strain ATCC 14672 / DSM 40746 / JCM 4963 / KCTC 9882 / NRRL B-12104 / FH 1290) TaxID=566461 RepID=D6A0J2_STRV1|nr:predicted protein [Streptomyces viridosporus ATCC 14672]
MKTCRAATFTASPAGDLVAPGEVTKLQLIRREWGSMSACSRTAGPAVAARTSDGSAPLIAAAN